jgi:hypothetical protein
MNNYCTCGVEDCNRLLRYRIETLREIFSVMRAGDEAREAMKLKWEEACYDPIIKQTSPTYDSQKHTFSPITFRFERRCFGTEDRVS